MQMETGVYVQTNAELGVGSQAITHLSARTLRRPDEEGTIARKTEYLGSDIWWVRHDGGAVAPYSADELEVLEPV